MKNNHVTSDNLSKLFYSRLITENGFALLLQYLGLMLCNLTTTQSVIWLASGTALALTFMRGAWVLPGIWLGSFLAYYFVKAPLLISFSIATLFTTQTYALYYLTQRFINPTLVFSSKYRLLAFSTLCATVSFLTGFALITLLHRQNAWYLFSLANFNGILIIGCALTTWDMYFPDLDLFQPKKIKFLIVLFTLLIVTTLLLSLTYSVAYTGFYLTLIFIFNGIISYRAGWPGAVLANFVLGLTLALDSYLGSPLFRHGNLTLLLSTYLAVNVGLMNYLAIASLK